jgi:hypothetical protein
MSLARLAAIARRGAARVGALADVARPTPDPIAVLDTAAATEAAGRTDPASRRAPLPPGLPPQRQPPSQRQPPPRATLVAPPALRPGASPPSAAASLAAEPRAVPKGEQPQPPEVVAPSSRNDPEPPPAVIPAVMTAPQPTADIEALPDRSVEASVVIPQPVIAATEPPAAARDHAEPLAVMPAPLRLPATTTARVAAAPAPDPAPPLVPVFALIADAQTPPAPAQEAQTGPPIVIDQIEIVMAPPPRPPPAPPPAPDRGFARYAAMRSARDRARW